MENKCIFQKKRFENSGLTENVDVHICFCIQSVVLFQVHLKKSNLIQTRKKKKEVF